MQGSNIAECSPITTDYIWRARDRGAKLIMVDPRITPLGRTADLMLPLKPGSDLALTNAVLHLLNKWGMIDRTFLEAHTTGFDAAIEAVKDCTPEWASELTGLPVAAIEPRRVRQRRNAQRIADGARARSIALRG